MREVGEIFSLKTLEAEKLVVNYLKQLFMNEGTNILKIHSKQGIEM